MELSGLIGGRAARNVYAGDRAAVKAFEGPLPESASGIEFWTDVRPDPGGPPGRASWSAGRNGVRELESGHLVVIPAKITKRRD